MQILRDKLNGMSDVGRHWVTVDLFPSEAPVWAVATFAEEMHWHVKAVWRGEANVTHVLLRYEAP